MGGRVRNLAILEALAPHFDLEILTLVHDRSQLDDPGGIGRLGRWSPVLAWNRRGPLHRLLAQAAYRSSGSAWGRESWFLGAHATAAVAARIIRERPPDAVHAAYWYTLRHLRGRSRPPLWVLDTHDVQFERGMAARGGTSPREKQEEIAELRKYDVVVAITPRDAETFRGLIPSGGRIETIGMGVDLDHWRRPDEPSDTQGDVVFYGYMGSEPNRSAAVHLCTEILPHLLAIRPGVTVLIAGADPAPEVRRLAALPGVRVTGRLDDPRILLSACRTMALPLRAASGIRSRACEVMGLELPVVAYPEAVAGMGFEADRDLLLATDTPSFAAQIARLLDDSALVRRITASARKKVADLYGMDATYGQFVELYRSLLDR